MKKLNDDFPPLDGVAKIDTSHRFAMLASVNVNTKIEKKNGLSYLSWAWAVDQLMRHDPQATWEYRDPVRWGDTVMVFCTVTAFGKAMTAQLPVMNHRNQAIANPDAFAVNTAMQRCLVKSIALHGLGLYIYAGEDLPQDEGSDEDAEWAEGQAMQIRSLIVKQDIAGAALCLNSLGVGGVYDGEAKEAVWSRLESPTRSAIKAYDAITQAKTLDELTAAWKAAPKHSHELLLPVATKRKSELVEPEQAAA